MHMEVLAPLVEESTEQAPEPGSELDSAQAAELAEKKARAIFHRVLGTLATVLVLVAVVVALWRMQTIFGVSAWQALGIGATAIPWIVGVLLLGVVFSMGTTRAMLLVEAVYKRVGSATTRTIISPWSGISGLVISLMAISLAFYSVNGYPALAWVNLAVTPFSVVFSGRGMMSPSTLSKVAGTAGIFLGMLLLIFSIVLVF